MNNFWQCVLSTQRLKITAMIIVLLVLLLNFSIPFAQGPLIFETFYNAAIQFQIGLNPYASGYGFDLFKYSPTFLMTILVPLSQLDLTAAAFIWQFVSVALWLIALYLVTKKLPLNRSIHWTWSILIVVSTLHDIFANSSYLQSNTIILAGMLLSIHCYQLKKWFLAAFILAFVTNMKLVPIVLTLLLFIDRQYRFIIWSFLSHCILAAVPFILGVKTAVLLYQGWFEALVIDRHITWTDDIHHYLSVKPFSQLHFNYVWQDEYFILVGLTALILAYLCMRLLHHERMTHLNSHLFLVVSLLFILVFNTRTEGPSLVFLSAVYPFFACYCLNKPSLFNRLSFILIFALTSLSTTDLFRGTLVQIISWDNNLRFLGLITLFIGSIFILIQARDGTKNLFIQSTTQTSNNTNNT